MPVPDFSPGEVLTAAAMDSIGLWLVKTQTVGTGVSSVTVSDAFSADYDAYKIIWSNGTMSVDTNLRMTIGNATTLYYGSLIYASFSGGGVQEAGNNNLAQFNWSGGGDTDGANASVELLNPFLTKATQMQARIRYSTVYGNFVGHLANNNSYTSFGFSPSSGTMTGGTIRVYGYRN
jgi:hypothetical protein